MPLWNELMAVTIAAVLVWVGWKSLRFCPPSLSAFILLGAPLVLLYAQSAWRTMGWHTLWHTSLVYEIAARGLPAQHPLLAGEPVGYVHSQHALLAAMVNAFSISPTWLFPLFAFLSLALSVVVLDRLAQMLSLAPGERLVAIALAICGASPLSAGFVARSLAHSGFAELRFSPWFKFANTNSNVLGILFYAVALWGLIRLLTESPVSRRTYALLAGGIVAAGIFYPFAWAGIGSACAATVLVLLWERRLETRVLLWKIAICAGGAALVSAPIILAATSQREAGGTTRLVLPEQFGILVLKFVLVFAIPAVVAWSQRDALRALSSRTPAAKWLFVAAVGTALPYFVLHFAIRSQYKFVLFAWLPIGLLLSVAFVQLARKRRWLGGLVLALALYPIASNVIHVSKKWKAELELRESGRNLVPVDPDHASLYRFVSEQTPPDAVVIDLGMSIPALTGRPLLVAVHGAQYENVSDGFGFPAKVFLNTITAADRSVVEKRVELVTRLLGRDAGPITVDLVPALREQASGRPLYVVARRPMVRRRLAPSSYFERVFEGDVAEIYRVKYAATESSSAEH